MTTILTIWAALIVVTALLWLNRRRYYRRQKQRRMAQALRTHLRAEEDRYYR